MKTPNYPINNTAIDCPINHYQPKSSILSSMAVHDDVQEEYIEVMTVEPELVEPPMYAVVMYNDDYTPMEFVVMILQTQFYHPMDEAVQIMLDIHHSGKGIAGIFPKDIAETKANAVNTLARKEGYPLLTQIESRR